jgi:hypothetical protein
MMKAAAILITMSDGSTWQVPAKLVAENRARHYEDEGDFAGEVDFALTDEYTLLDWASNNMDWEYVEEFAIKVATRDMKPEDYQEGWVNGKKQVIEEARLELPAAIFNCSDCGELVEVDRVRCSKCTSKAKLGAGGFTF